MSMFFRPAFAPKVQRLHLNFSRTEARLARRKSAGSSPRRAPPVHSRGPTWAGHLARGKAHRTGQGADPSQSWPGRAAAFFPGRAGRQAFSSVSQGPIGLGFPTLICGAPWWVVPGVAHGLRDVVVAPAAGVPLERFGGRPSDSAGG